MYEKENKNYLWIEGKNQKRKTIYNKYKEMVIGLTVILTNF